MSTLVCQNMSKYKFPRLSYIICSVYLYIFVCNETCFATYFPFIDTVRWQGLYDKNKLFKDVHKGEKIDSMKE